jgi:hypothetical protein
MVEHSTATVLKDTLRRKRRCAIFVGAVTLSALTVRAQILPPSPQMPDARCGEHIVLRLKTVPTGDARVTISRDGTNNASTPLIIDQANLTGTFAVDSSLSPGRYIVKLLADGREEQVPGELRVLPDNVNPVHIDEIYPNVRYPDSSDTIELIGTNFAEFPADNHIEFVGQPAPQFGTEKDCLGPAYTKVCVVEVPGMKSHRIRIAGLSNALKTGPIGIHVSAGAGLWSNVVNITTVPRSISTIRLFAFAVVVVVAFATYLLSKRAARTQTAGSGLTPISVLLLDPETGTYSLSKFQVLVWTGIFVFAYVYLALCRTLVQWAFDWPPVPKNFPELLGITAGAGVLAAGISSLKGPKGAGGVRPSAADFITTGGVVAAERLQFFIWTIVGALTFLYLVLRINPATLQELPTIPDTFLYLMGFSSAAYLGGKLARKPGPVVKNISVQQVTPLPDGDAQMTIVVEGENLGQNATFRIDGEQIRTTQLTVKKRIPDPPQDGFCTRLEIQINQAAKYAEGVHTLTIVNVDGQSADVAFPVSPLTIKEVSATADANGVYLAVKGANFVGRVDAQWVPEGNDTPVLGAVSRTSEEAITVKLPVGTKGAGKLALISASGLRQSRPMKVG